MRLPSDATLEDVDYDLALLKCPEVPSPPLPLPLISSLFFHFPVFFLFRFCNFERRHVAKTSLL